MLADSAVKYINSSASLAPPAAATEHAQLQAARPLLRTLALAAVEQLHSCMVLLGTGGGPGGGGAMLTHTSSLRACCLLLRAVLTLMAEALEPLLLVQPGGGALPGALPPHLLEMLELELPPGMEQLLAAHQQALQQAHAALQQAAQHVVAVAQAAGAAPAVDPAGAAAGQPQPQEQPQGGEGGQGGQAAAAAAAAPPQGAATPAASAAAVVAEQPLHQSIPLAAQEALAADASVLLQASHSTGRTRCLPVPGAGAAAPALHARAAPASACPAEAV